MKNKIQKYNNNAKSLTITSFSRESGLLQLPEIIQQNIIPNVSSALIVTDNGLQKNTTWIDNVSYALQESLECNVKIYDSSPVNPRIETVEEITNIALENKSDIIISIGGGSCIDAGKCAAMYVSPENNNRKLAPSKIFGIPSA
eukprot:96946_1